MLVCACLLPAVAQAAEIVRAETSDSLSQSVLGSTVIPYKEVTLSAQVSGVVKVAAGEAGSSFKQGDVIIQVDESQLLAKRNSVLAQIAIAQAALQNSQAQYTRELVSPRSKDIGNMPGFGLPAMFDIYAVRPFADSFMGNYNSDMGRYTDLMSSATGVSQAQSNLQQAVSQLQEIDAALRDAKSVAPFEGIILEKMVEVGDTVQPGQPLIKYGYVKYKRLLADVPSGLVGNLSEEMVVPVRIDGNINSMAKVSQIYPVADPNRHTVTVKFDLPVDIVAAPGMYAEVYLPEPKKGGAKVVIIPKTALLTGRSLPSVLVVKDNNTSELRLVRLGADQGEGKVEVVSGLSADERVIDKPPAGASSGWMPSANQ
ncbi:efflux RND transporter periplasmic adaptor subunit [Candidatus Thiothrix sp. Deng01]|uniref:Efflux RND transporter periplasmic adaptor subunit n=1 Tax=Candidatus Thiothrix phosphatis TaxID=3112415 RepID=A0ABU6CZA7_9GAMM|nr:efflux RND transporter periplasmic adaptor subunit [Candidatus Thiothrix sp. Deng01]MEB4592167.1 efflux RND transporter periplasmic adaptor subunit [Candidatus Thiothrix sp. Deng01]